MKKIGIAVLTAMLAVATASAKTKVVTTIFSAYDWAREVIGTKDAEITMLLDNGVDLHSYQPTIQDIAKISECDVFVYVGGESDGWVEGALKNVRNKNMQVVNLMKVMGDRAKVEEVKEGMEAEHDHGSHSHGPLVESEITDRPLSDFAGNYQDQYPYLADGSLDHYIEHKAEESGKSEAETRAALLRNRKSDFSAITIKGKKVTFKKDGKNIAADYKYAGKHILRNDDGSVKSVYYAYEIAKANKNAPRFIILNDHNGNSKGKKPETPHFHIRYGNTPVATLLTMEWTPTYYDAKADAEDIEEALLGHHHEGEEEEELDEHVWLSLRNAQLLTSAICDALCAVDSSNAVSYRSNLSAYNAKLARLDAEYAAVTRNASNKTLVFCDRFPFRYLVDDYGLDYFAAFVGCSAETEASFETVAFLAAKVDELSLKNVVVIEKSDHKIARTVIGNSKDKSRGVLVLDSLQSTTGRDAKSGVTYLSVMKSNLDVLKNALK